MNYKCSRARREFEFQLGQAEQELVYLSKLDHKQSLNSRLLVAYYVYAYSLLEVYIKGIVEDSLNALSASGPAFDSWPDLMLGYFLHKNENLASHYRSFGYDEDEGAILERVAQTARNIASWSIGSKTLRITNAAYFLEKKKYPSPKNLPQLFKRLGIKNIWAAVGKAGKINGELMLTSLNDLRTSIVHEGKVPPGFSLGDFRNRLAQMRRFVAAIDRGVADHFCAGVIRRAAWNNSVS